MKQKEGTFLSNFLPNLQAGLLGLLAIVALPVLAPLAMWMGMPLTTLQQNHVRMATCRGAANTAVINPVLSTHAVKFMQDATEYVGRKLAPFFFTGKRAANYYVFNRENVLNIPKLKARSPGAEYSESMMELSDDSYNARNWGHKAPVDDEEREHYALSIDADKAEIERLMNIILVNHEWRVRDLAIGATVTSSSPGSKWDAGGSDPIADVNAVREIIHDNCGMDPNLMVLPRDVFNVLSELPAILDKIKYTQRGIITPDLLAPIFKVREIVVAGGLENTANEGQAMNISKIWGDSVILAHVDTRQNLKAPNFIRTMNWTGLTGPNGVNVLSYRDPARDSFIHRAKHYTDEKLVGAECGYHLSNVLTA